MKRRMSVTALVTLLLLVLSSVALGQELPPGPTVAYRSQLEVLTPPAQFDLIDLVLDFAPGAWTPPHSHGGQGLVTVLEGVITVREAGTERTFTAGQSWVENPGVVAEVGNAGQVNARVVASFLLPKGAPLTTVQQGESTQQLPPGPTVVYRSELEVLNPPAQFDLIQLVLDFAPGAWTPPHSHGGQGLVTVLEGVITVREAGTERTFMAGGSWVENPGVVAEVGNAGQVNARVVATFLLPKGAELTTVQPAAPPTAPGTLPDTGGTGSRYIWLALLAASGLIASGWLARRNVARA